MPEALTKIRRTPFNRCQLTMPNIEIGWRCAYLDFSSFL